MALVASNAVSITAIVAGWKQHANQLAHARTLSDLDAVRELLDDAAVLLHKLAYTLDSVRSNLGQFGKGFFADEERASPFTALTDQGQEADAALERLAIRFGPDHPVAKTFRAADEAAVGIHRELAVLRYEDPAEPGDQYAQRQLRELFDEKKQRIASLRSDFDAARQQFITAAAEAAGARLGA